MSYVNVLLSYASYSMAHEFSFNIIVVPVSFMFPCDNISPVSHNIVGISGIYTKEVVVLYPALFLDVFVFLLRGCWGCHLILFLSEV